MKKYAIGCLLIYTLLNPLVFAKTSFEIEKSTQHLLTVNHIQEKNLTAEELRNIKKAAKLRYEFMVKNIQTPQLFYKFLLPLHIKNTLPLAVHPFLETEISNIEGILEIREAVSLDGKETTQYVLQQNNKIYYLDFMDKPSEKLKTDAKIRVTKGYLLHVNNHEEHIVVSSEDIQILNTPAVLPLSFGPQTTLAILVNFSDQPTNRPWTTDAVKNTIFTNINNYYYEASYHQTTIAGQLAGWFVINVPSTASCNTLTDSIPTLANQAATAAGIDISQYRRRVYVFPRTTSCSWAGLGTVGGTTTRAWINGYGTSTLIIGHELGHNVGLGHASSLNCPTSPIEGSCTVSEYGDGTDMMGNINAGHFNAFQKDRLGWLNYQVSPPITTVTTSGSYFIDAYETFNKKPKALKILKRAGGSDYYYLEYRQGIGFDKPLADCGTNCDFTRGIVFHQGNPNVYNTSRLLDMSPGGGTRLVALLPCQSWTDPAAPNGGVTFLVQSVSNVGARVKVTFGGFSKKCQTEPLNVSLLPAQTPWIKSGTHATFALHLKNNDTKACAARNVKISLPTTPGVQFTLNETNLKLNPNDEKTVTLSAFASNVKTTMHHLQLEILDEATSKHTQVPFTVGVYQ